MRAFGWPIPPAVCGAALPACWFAAVPVAGVRDALPCPTMDVSVEGLGPLSERTFLNGLANAYFPTGGMVDEGGVLVSQLAAAKIAGLVSARGGDLRVSPEGIVCTPGVSILALFGGGVFSPERAAAAAKASFDPQERDVGQVAGVPLRVADAWVFGITHWSDLLWANMLAMGPFLWSRLGANPARLGWAALRAGSFKPERVAGGLVDRGRDCFVHPHATVEFSVLGDGVRVGAGAVVRGCILGDGAAVEELAMVEACVLGAGARIQRQAMAKFSVIEEGAAHAGVVQLGVLGRGSEVRQGAVLFDQSLGQGVQIRRNGVLEPAPHGMVGVCVGVGTILGQGVRVAAGRAIPGGLTVLPNPEMIVVRSEVPQGCTRVRVANGALEPA